jgi:hypothetical protein
VSRLKSNIRARRFKDGGKVLSEEITTPPSISVAADGAPEVTTEVLDSPREENANDEASLAFRAQIAALANAEEISRQRQASPVPQPQQPIDQRELRLAQWRQQGLSREQESFLRSNPILIDRPEITAFATAEADRDGYGADHPEHFEIVKKNFNRVSEEIERDLEAASQRAAARAKPAPEYSEPRSAPQRSSPTVGYAAPVSREVPSGGAYYSERRSSRVTLSPQEKEVARLSGISEEEYALGKMELQRRKEAGEIG